MIRSSTRARTCAALLLLSACRSRTVDDQGARDSATTGEATTPESPSGPRVDGDPFVDIEPLRPRQWAAWPLENVDPIGFDGWHISPTSGKFELEHGLVFASEPGAFVLAIADGRVAAVSRDAEDRIELTIEHGHGIVSHYAPLSEALVYAGLPVTRGSALALTQGNSMRLRVTVGGVDIDPLLVLRQPGQF